MISKEAFLKLALSFAHTEQTVHFNRIGFKVTGRRLYASYREADHTANIFLTPEEQALFCKMDPASIHPVPNKWGDKGATTFMLDKVERAFVQEALASAHAAVLSSSKERKKK